MKDQNYVRQEKGIEYHSKSIVRQKDFSLQPHFINYAPKY
jgi:hypothetical protein